MLKHIFASNFYKKYGTLIIAIYTPKPKLGYLHNILCWWYSKGVSVKPGLWTHGLDSGLDCGLRFGLDFGLMRSSMTTISNTAIAIMVRYNVA